MDDLIAFLNARLDADLRTIGVEPSSAEIGHALTSHGADRVLREVAAKRAILAEHAGRGDSIWCRTCDPAREDMDDSAAYFPCLTLRILAAVYSDHPDYRQEWKP